MMACSCAAAASPACCASPSLPGAASSAGATYPSSPFHGRSPSASPMIHDAWLCALSGPVAVTAAGSALAWKTSKSVAFQSCVPSSGSPWGASMSVMGSLKPSHALTSGVAAFHLCFSTGAGSAPSTAAAAPPPSTAEAGPSPSTAAAGPAPSTAAAISSPSSAVLRPSPPSPLGFMARSTSVTLITTPMHATTACRRRAVGRCKATPAPSTWLHAPSERATAW
ncbi:hypothetical protein T484DRAFT_1960706 [Baffinella frigidus]|nr:hypothetical protein T484DRAFT_1960706 [Cryptophyta sp. CCMP2293]